MSRELVISGRRFGKTAAAAQAAAMSIDDYRAMQRRLHQDLDAAKARHVEENCYRDFPRIFGGSDWVRQQFKRAEPRWRVMGVDVADRRATWCAMEWDANGVATVVSVGGRVADPSWQDGGFIFTEEVKP